MSECLIDGCAKPVKARGWCKMHYLRWFRRGDPLVVKSAGNGDALAFLLREAVRPTTDDCVLWPFSKNEHGRGNATYEGRVWNASRLVCYLINGPAPKGKRESAHSCGNGHLGCVSGKHLRWASRSENMMDKVIHGTHNRGERHPLSKLSKDDITAIRSLRGVESQRTIAARFGISPGHVSGIQTKTTWSWF